MHIYDRGPRNVSTNTSSLILHLSSSVGSLKCWLLNFIHPWRLRQGQHFFCLLSQLPFSVSSWTDFALPCFQSQSQILIFPYWSLIVHSNVLLQVSSVFSPGNFQGFALVNRQRTNRISTGFTVEVSTEGTQLSYSNFDYLGQEPHYWQLPGVYQGDKVSIKERTQRLSQWK